LFWLVAPTWGMVGESQVRPGGLDEASSTTVKP